MRRPLCWLALLFFFLLLPITNQRGWKQGITKFKGSEVTLEGQIAEKSKKNNSYKEYWQITLKDAVCVENGNRYPLEGRYLISLKSEEKPLLGQKVRVRAVYDKMEAATNPGQFDQGKWYYSMGILGKFQKGEILMRTESYSIVPEAMWSIREKAFLTLEHLLGKKEGALMAAMLLGEKSGLEEESKSLYQRNGISHVLAISGLHLSLLGMGVFGILKRIVPLPKIAAFLTAIFMIFYCNFSGNSISAIRATIMFVLSLLAIILNRSYDSLTALAISSVFLLFFNPYSLQNSGFLLSFLAVIGVTYAAPILKQFLGVKGKLSSSLVVSISASITTIPVLLCSYGTYPWYSILLNLFILPPMSALLGMTVVLLLFSYLTSLFTTCYLLEFIQKGMSFGIKAILKYIEICCTAFEYFPFRDGYLGAPSLIQIVVYSILLLIFLYCVRQKIMFGSDTVMKLLFLFLLLFLTLSFRFGAEITMLDVGQGDCIVIRNSNGKVYLSDCGSSSSSQVGKYRLIPFLKERGYGRIEAIFLSHLDQDHCNGVVELLQQLETERVKVNTIIFSEGIKAEKETETFKTILSLAKAQGVKITYMKKGDQILDRNMSFTCLHPSQEEGGNNGSLVLEVSYGKFQLLLTGDVEKKGEEKLAEELKRRKTSYEVLKVAHHGSDGSSSMEFIRKVSPKVSLISCGRNNSYGHPSKEVVKRLEAVGSTIFDTRNQGAVTIYPKRNGRFWVEVFLE